MNSMRHRPHCCLEQLQKNKTTTGNDKMKEKRIPIETKQIFSSVVQYIVDAYERCLKREQFNDVNSLSVESNGVYRTKA